MPGTLVFIVPNSPRTSAGASGLGSHMSIWLGPPRIHKSRTLLPALSFAAAVDLFFSAASRFWSDKPAAPRTPACTTARRERRRNSSHARRRWKGLDMVVGVGVRREGGQLGRASTFTYTFFGWQRQRE